MKKRVLAIIPARGGSRGIPRKNIKVLAGKPLIAWTIEQAASSGLFDKVIVSTEDNEIAEISAKFGAEVPFLRPKELAEDHTPTLPVLIHALSWFKEQGQLFDYVVLLEPTYPLRKVEDINQALEMLESKNADSVVSVVSVPLHFNPHWQLVADEKNILSLFTGKNVKDIIPQRQLLPKTYMRNGAIYALRSDLLLQQNPTLYGDVTHAYVMDENETLDINDQNDWDLIEKKILGRNN